MEKDFLKALEAHAESDKAFQAKDQEYKDKDIEEKRKLNERMDGLATKEDIEQVLDFMKQLNVGIGIFRFTWDNASKIGSFIFFLVGIWFLFKYGVVAALLWISKNSGL